MPLYEYACHTCEHTFEALVFDGDKVECPSCHGDKLERQWSVPAQPRSTTSSLAMGGCAPDLPPCGPGCCRLPGRD
jgi:putative FmdB family regulatory protein